MLIKYFSNFFCRKKKNSQIYFMPIIHICSIFAILNSKSENCRYNSEIWLLTFSSLWKKCSKTRILGSFLDAQNTNPLVPHMGPSGGSRDPPETPISLSEILANFFPVPRIRGSDKKCSDDPLPVQIPGIAKRRFFNVASPLDPTESNSWGSWNRGFGAPRTPRGGSRVLQTQKKFVAFFRDQNGAVLGGVSGPSGTPRRARFWWVPLGPSHA